MFIANCLVATIILNALDFLYFLFVASFFVFLVELPSGCLFTRGILKRDFVMQTGYFAYSSYFWVRFINSEVGFGKVAPITRS